MSFKNSIFSVHLVLSSSMDSFLLCSLFLFVHLVLSSSVESFIVFKSSRANYSSSSSGFFSLSSISLESQIFIVFFRLFLFFYGNRVFKTWYLCGIIVSNSASRKRVFKPRVLYGTRVSKTRDVNLLKPFKRVLTYYIQSPYYANPQISPVFNHHDAWHGVWGCATISWWIVLYVWWEGVKGALRTNSYIGGWWIFINNQKVLFPSLWLSNAPNNLLM